MALRIFYFIFLWLFSITVAFASADNEYRDKLPKISKAPTVLVMPIDGNELIEESELALISEELIGNFKKAKFSARWLEADPAAVKEYRDSIPLRIRDDWRLRNYLTDLVKTLKPETELVAFPFVIEKPATLKGSLAKLDGNSFKIPKVRKLGDKDLPDAFSWSRSEWSGKRLAFSLRVVTFDNTGKWLFTSYGGLAFPDVAVSEEQRFYRRKHFFVDKKEIRSMEKGVKRALYPFRKKLKRSKK